MLENMLRKMFGGKIPERTETNASPTQTNDEQYALGLVGGFGFGFPFGELSLLPTSKRRRR